MGVIWMNKWAHIEVGAKEWAKGYELPSDRDKRKVATLRVAQGLFPEGEFHRESSRAKDGRVFLDGRSDAVMIGEYGRRYKGE